MARRQSSIDFPKTIEVQDALVFLIYERGGEYRALFGGETYSPIADLLSVGARERLITRAEDLRDGRNEAYWHTQVQFAKERLLKTGDLECPRRGIWMLTEKGASRPERVKASMGTMSLLLITGYTFTRVCPVHLKAPSEITLEDLGL